MRLDHLANAVVRGVVPFQPALRRLKRQLAPYRDNPANSAYCVSNGLDQLAALRAAGISVRDAVVLEFGTGWLPLIPFLFHLAGARRLILTDIARLMDAQTIERARGLIAERLPEIAGALGEAEAALAARLATPLPHDYLVPWDAAAHPPASVDLITSRTVFEHVPAPQLRFFLAQFHRVLRPGGATCHLVDNSDHWQHHDRALSRVEFLRYEERDWRWRLAQINPQAYQNRLRHTDYQRLLTEAGFTLRLAQGEADATCLADLARLPLASGFTGRDPRDLAVLTSLFVASRA